MAVLAGALITNGPSAQAAVNFPIESLDGSGNNVANPAWGQAGTAYTGSCRPGTPTAAASRSPARTPGS